MNKQVDGISDLIIQHVENNLPTNTENDEAENYPGAIDAKNFHNRDLMSEVYPSDELNLVISETGVGNDSISGDQDDLQHANINQHKENSESSTLPNIEGPVAGFDDDTTVNKDLQEELMRKVLPSSEECVTDTVICVKNSSNSNDTDYQNYLDYIKNGTILGDNAESLEAKPKKHKKSKDKDKSKKEKKDNKRKSNLVPLDAYFSPLDEGSSTPDNFKKVSKKKKVSDIPSENTTSEFNNAAVLGDIKINQEEICEDIKEKEDEDGNLEEGEIKEVVELEEGELRELEEGELPEDIEMIDDTRDMSVITKSIPIDFDEFNRKRKVALLLSYCGAGFHGMQKNPEVETIELRLMEALAAIRAIRPDLKNEFLNNNNNQLSFNRAARTDKGVSAARQVVSLKVIANEDFLKDVNKHLPKEIRVFGIERVTKTFDAKCSCSGRSYEYLVPTVAFAPSKEIMDSTYRLSDEQFDRIIFILGKYIGTHNFHNFTSGKRFSDKSATRYITDFKASKPFECRGHEFISLEVQGQSFLIHQIRKMIGLCMAICRGYCPEDTVDKSWMEPKLDIPKAPGLGLLLNRVNFKSYNQKYGSDGRHNPLTWENCELEVERYKIEYLWHTIIEEEIKKSSLIHWLKTLNNHTYTEAGMNAPMNSDYKGKKGIFPALRDNRRYEPNNGEGAPCDPRDEGSDSKR